MHNFMAEGRNTEECNELYGVSKGTQFWGVSEIIS